MGVHLVAAVAPDGALTIYGALTMNGQSLPDGRSSAVLVGAAPQATCADTDGDGIAGITFLQLTGRIPDTGDEVLVAFVAGDHDLDERGTYDVRLAIGDLNVAVAVKLLPLPAGLPSGGER